MPLGQFQSSPYTFDCGIHTTKWARISGQPIQASSILKTLLYYQTAKFIYQNAKLDICVCQSIGKSSLLSLLLGAAANERITGLVIEKYTVLS